MNFDELPLRDIHLPEPLSWWPPAVGWWILTAVVLAALVVLWLHHRRGRVRRATLKTLNGIVTRLREGEEPVTCLQELSMVLRRFAITAGARSASDLRDVAGLTGERWLRYLDSRWERTEFTTALGRRLVAAPYRRPRSVSTEEALELGVLCTDWVRAQAPEG
jgi:hypothetical protein